MSGLTALLGHESPGLPRGHELVTGKRTAVLALLAATQLIGVIDFSIVTVALPSIGRQFALRADQLQWVVSASFCWARAFLMRFFGVLRARFARSALVDMLVASRRTPFLVVPMYAIRERPNGYLMRLLSTMK